MTKNNGEVWFTQVDEWKEQLKQIHPVGDCCGCYDGDLDDLYPKAHKKLEDFVSQLLSTQEEKIFKQLETIDVKMGDPGAEAKVKFAIKAMIRHLKLKKEKDDSSPSINTDSATTR
jgi:hypothetical protein